VVAAAGVVGQADLEAHRGIGGLLGRRQIDQRGLVVVLQQQIASASGGHCGQRQPDLGPPRRRAQIGGHFRMQIAVLARHIDDGVGGQQIFGGTNHCSFGHCEPPLGVNVSSG
jgi:hypothetical protein